MPRLARMLPLALLVGCGHATAARSPESAAPEVAAPEVAARPAPEPTDAAPAGEQRAAQVITFDGDDAEPEPATMVRSAPPRPKIPAFQLFGTRTGDGPR